MVPDGESPLLLPANQHKQLVVIDFEYSNANLPGLEFANHFVSIFLRIFSRYHGFSDLYIVYMTADNNPDRVDVQLP